MFWDGRVGEVGIDGLAAEVGEGLEVLAEGGVALVFFGEDFVDAGGEFGDFGGELSDGILPVGNVWLLVVEEELEDFDELCGIGDGFVEGYAVVLVEDGVGGILEERVDCGVALGYLLLDLRI